MQEEYSKKYQELKPDKKLHWVHQMGTLKLSIELEAGTLEVDATPLEAAVIESFSEQRESISRCCTFSLPFIAMWNQMALSYKLGVTEKTLLSALISWNEQGILACSGTTWTLVEEGNAPPPGSHCKQASITGLLNKGLLVSVTPAKAESTSAGGAQRKQDYSQDQQQWQVRCMFDFLPTNPN